MGLLSLKKKIETKNPLIKFISSIKFIILPSSIYLQQQKNKI